MIVNLLFSHIQSAAVFIDIVINNEFYKDEVSALYEDNGCRSSDIVKFMAA